MKNVKYINAGAGSGKTYTLTSELADLVIRGVANPGQVIMTTFTERAAAEMRTKAKSMLLSRGLADAALQVDYALIGTIHGVAYQLIRKFWFFLGLPPELNVMDEEDQAAYVAQSVADLPEDSELRFLHHFAREFNVSDSWGNLSYDFWMDDLKSIVALSTNYEVSDFSASKAASCDFFRRFVVSDDAPLPSEAVFSDALNRIIDTWTVYAQNKKPNAANDKRIDQAKSLLSKVRKRDVAWLVDFGSQCTGIRGAALDVDIQELIGRCANIYRSPMVFAEVEKYINMIFRLADRWKDNYAAFKAERNILDYDDMEKYLLRLLEMPEVLKEISASYKYLFVDEYQDCSPIQVKIFDRLSDVMTQSYWVGDSKQAIYAFRGSATELTRAVMGKIARHEDGCTTETLKYSWRSQPGIVNLCNKVFTQVYANVYGGDMTIDNIVLEPKRPLPGEDLILPDLCYCDITGNRGGGDPSLAEQVAYLIHKGVEKPSDIAILCRRNEGVAKVAAALRELGIPCNAASLYLPDYKATTLLFSLLALVISPRNVLAKATIAYLTEEGCDLSEIIQRASYDNRRTDDADDQEVGSLFNMNQLIVRASNLPAYMAQQSVGALVESIIIELRLFDEVKKFDDPASQISCLNSLIEEAYRFEERCSKNGRPASLSGFINYVNDSKVLCGGDPDGVQVLTYHKSKGLQWKRVFLCDMENDSFDDLFKLIRNSVFGIHREYVSQPEADNLYPEVRIRVAPWIFGSKKKLPDEDIVSIIEDTPLFSAIRHNEVSQSANLLYVGMTRPQNCLTLVLKASSAPLAWPSLLGVSGVGEDLSHLLGTEEYFCDCIQDADDWEDVLDRSSTDLDDEYRRALVARCQSNGRSLRDLQPSRIPGYAMLGRVLPVCDRLSLTGDFSMDEVGNCIHQIFAYVDDYTPDRQLSFTQNVIDAYGLAETLAQPQSLLDAWCAVKRTLTDLYGPAECIYHERPFSLNRYGHLLNGSMDLVWHTPSGDVLVDFKTCPMGKNEVTNTESPHYAGIYAGQLDVYSDALEAANAKVLSRWIFYPVIGLLVEVLDNQRPFFDDNVEMMLAETNSLTHSIIVDEFVFFGNVDFSKLREDVPALIDGVIAAIPLSMSDIFNGEDDILPDDIEDDDIDEDDILPDDDDLSDDDEDGDESSDDEDDVEDDYDHGMDNNIRLAIRGGSSQGIDMFCRDGAEVIRIPYVASQADIHLACVILRYVSKKYGLTIYRNKEIVDVDAPELETSLYEDRKSNVRLLLNAESFEHLAINGINNTLNINLKTLRQEMPGASASQIVDHVIDRLIALQWDYLDYHGTWCFSLGEGGNRRVFVKIDNSEDVIVPFCNTVILFLHATPVVISQSDFYSLAVESPYVEAVDSLQLAMRQMPPNDWEDLWFAAAQKANFHPKTYLLRWNPEISSFSRDAYAGMTAKNNDFAMDWSIHEWQDAKLGDFFFMVCVGKESEADGTAGVVFRGEIVTPPYLAPDWNEGNGARPFRHYVDISCRHCAPADGEPCISLAQLNEAIPEIDWGHGHSGVLLSPDVAARLSELWSKLNP